MLRICTAIALLVSLLISATAFADGGGSTIADIVVASAGAEAAEFTTLLAAVSAADPAILEALADPEAALTVSRRPMLHLPHWRKRWATTPSRRF